MDSDIYSIYLFQQAVSVPAQEEQWWIADVNGRRARWRSNTHCSVECLASCSWLSMPRHVLKCHKHRIMENKCILIKVVVSIASNLSLPSKNSMYNSMLLTPSHPPACRTIAINQLFPTVAARPYSYLLLLPSNLCSNLHPNAF